MLKKVDFPTFGSPTSPTCGGQRTREIRCDQGPGGQMPHVHEPGSANCASAVGACTLGIHLEVRPRPPQHHLGLFDRCLGRHRRGQREKHEEEDEGGRRSQRRHRLAKNDHRLEKFRNFQNHAFGDLRPHLVCGSYRGWSPSCYPRPKFDFEPSAEGNGRFILHLKYLKQEKWKREGSSPPPRSTAAPAAPQVRQTPRGVFSARAVRVAKAALTVGQ